MAKRSGTGGKPTDGTAATISNGSGGVIVNVNLPDAGNDGSGADGEFGIAGDVSGVDAVASGSDNGVAEFDPSSADNSEQSPAGTGPGGSGTGKRKRGRPPGSGTGSKSRASAKNAAFTLNNLLFSLHLMGANLLKAPGWKLTKEEANELGNAITVVMEEYGTQVADPRILALVNLASVVCIIYGPRVFMSGAVAVIEGKPPKQAVVMPFNVPVQ